MNYQNVALNHSQRHRVSIWAAQFPNYHTAQAYSRDLAQFIHWAENEKAVSLRMAGNRKVQSLFKEYQTCLKPLAPSSVTRKLKVVRYYLNYLGIDLGDAAHVPTSRALSVSYVVTPHTANDILKHTGLTARQRFLIALMSLEGLSVSTICALEFDPAHRESSAQSNEAIPYLIAYLVERGELPGRLILSQAGNPVSRQYVWKEVRKAGELAHYRGICPASLRASYALRLHHKGVSRQTIAELMNVDIQTVNRILRK